VLSPSFGGAGVVFGPGGVGKSTLAAAIAHDVEVQQNFPDGTLWVTLGQQPSLLSLLGGWVQALGDYQFHSSSVDATSTHLRSLLHRKRTLLVIDDGWSLSDVAPFLVAGPSGRMLITTRDALIAKSKGAWLYEVEMMTPDQAHDLLAARLGHRLEGVEKRQSDALAEAVGYLPLALELAAAQVADGVSWSELLKDLTAEVARLESLDLVGTDEIHDETLRKSLSLTASFNLSLRRLPEDKYRAFAWMGILPEDVLITSVMSATLWDMDEFSSRANLRYFRDKALLQLVSSNSQGSHGYHLHDLLHDQARKLLVAVSEEKTGTPGLGLELSQAHAQLLGRYRRLLTNGQWNALPTDGYIHEHLTWHLEKANLAHQIHELLAEDFSDGFSKGWYSVKEALHQVSGYIEDVTRAWQLADQSFLAGERDKSIGLQCRYALIFSSLASRFRYLAPALIIAMVQKEAWTIDQASSYALRIPNEENRHETLQALQVLQEWLELRQQGDVTARVAGLADIAARMPEKLRDGVLKETAEALQQIENDEDRCQAILKIASLMPEAMVYFLLRMTLCVADPSLRQSTFTRLNEYLPEPLDYDSELDIESITNEAIEILDLARASGGFMYGEESLPTFFRQIGFQLSDELEEHVLKAAELITIDEQVLIILRAAVPFLNDKSLERAIESFPLGWSNETAEPLRILIIRLPDSLLPLALKIVANTHGEQRQESMSIVAPHLDIKSLNRALELSREIEDSSVQLKALSNLIFFLAKIGRPKEALLFAQRLNDPRWCSRILIGLASDLPEEVLEDAAMIAQSLESELGLEVLIALSPRLTAKKRQQLAEELFSTAKGKKSALLHDWEEESWGNMENPHDLRQSDDELAAWLRYLSLFNPDGARAIARTVAEPEPRLKRMYGEQLESTKDRLLENLKAPLDYDDAVVSMLWNVDLDLILPKFSKEQDKEKLSPLAKNSTRSSDSLAAELINLSKIREKDQLKKMSVAAGELATVSTDEIFQVWRVVLQQLAGHYREEALLELCSLATVIAALGGPRAVEQTIQSIRDIGGFWL
jgi:hypothetical protein